LKGDSETFVNSQGYAQVGAKMFRYFDLSCHRMNDAEQANQFFLNVGLARFTSRQACTRGRTHFEHFAVNKNLKHGFLNVMKLAAHMIQNHIVINPSHHWHTLMPLFK